MHGCEHVRAVLILAGKGSNTFFFHGGKLCWCIFRMTKKSLIHFLWKNVAMPCQRVKGLEGGRKVAWGFGEGCSPDLPPCR